MLTHIGSIILFFFTLLQTNGQGAALCGYLGHVFQGLYHVLDLLQDWMLQLCLPSLWQSEDRGGEDTGTMSANVRRLSVR